MYNHKANQIWINRVKNAVNNKRILLVGNSPTVFSHTRGDLIDSYDFVVRFGRGVMTPNLQPYIGSKCDMWFTGCLRIGMYRWFKKAPFKVFCYAQRNAYYDNQVALLINKFMFNDMNFQLYKDYFLTGTLDNMLGMIKTVYGDVPVDSESRISQGAFCLTWFLTQIQTQAHIDMIGFDFNTAKIAYKTKDGAEKVAYSWHIPMNKKDGLHENVHASGIEAEYVEKQVEKGLVTWHKDDPTDLNMDMLNKIAKKNRPNRSTDVYEIQ